MILRLHLVLFCLMLCFTVHGKNLIETVIGKDLNQTKFLTQHNLMVGGWLASGYTYNPLHPKDRSNGPVQFNNRANEFNVHQLGLYVEKSVDHNIQQWQLGGRFEFMFGTDTPNTQATGHWDSHLINPSDLRVYDIALPQVYLELFAPIGKGLSAKFGHFYSILGYESVPSPPNLFVSHSYSMKSSPFTMTGVLLGYPVNNNLTLQGGAVTGPDNLDQHAGAWSFIGGFTLEKQDHSRGVTFSILDGDVDDTLPSHLTYYYAMLHQDLTANLHYVFQHDYGQQQNARPRQQVDWYSLVNYLTYDIANEWSAGLRVEWFRDDDGTRFSIQPGSYYAISAAINWKPNAWLTVRPELRYDWSDGLKPFDVGSRKDQLLLSVDTVIRF